jgi:cyclopropane-fatty-acyl-phospholipid synthase
LSTQAEIQETYDVSNDFYRLFLDERMTYSCGLFDESDDLERAQLNKLHWIANAAGVAPGMRVLDIGCGWGGNLDFLARERGAGAAVGITLSPAQYRQASTLDHPAIEVHLTSYTDYRPRHAFDAVTSIGMFEHIATPEQARTGRNVDAYRDYFRRVWGWTRPGARFGLQSVVSLRIPRDRGTLRRMGVVTAQIFPGAVTPRLESIVASVNPYWEVAEVQMRRPHYARTLAHWHRRLLRNESVIRERWGDQRFEDYDRYLLESSRAFEAGWLTLAQLSLERLEAPGAGPRAAAAQQHHQA